MMVRFLARWLRQYDPQNDNWQLALPTPDAGGRIFTDAMGRNDEVAYAAEWLYDLGNKDDEGGVFRGYLKPGSDDRELLADTEINRYDAVIMVVRALGTVPGISLGSIDITATPRFTDAPDDYITIARKIGITTGYSDGLFHPEATLTRGQMAAIISRAMRYADEQRNSTGVCPSLPPGFLHAGGMDSVNSLAVVEHFRNNLCFPAASTANIPDLEITSNGTPVCYEFSNQTFRVINDVPASYWARGDIEAMFNAGITVGCGGNGSEYCPDDFITRAHAIIFLLRAKYHLETGEPGTNYDAIIPPATEQIFDDVPVEHPYAAWINQAYYQGITTGFNDNTFRPDIPTTRSNWAVFMLRTLYGSDVLLNLPNPMGIYEDISIVGLDEEAKMLAAAYEEMYWKGFTTGSSGCGPAGLRYCPDENVSRAQAAVFVNRGFINLATATERLGDFCFSTAGSYDIPRNGATPGLSGVKDDDIVCYHDNINRIKMYFNGSANGVGGDIDALHILDDGEFLFSTGSSTTIPEIGNVKDEDIIRYDHGTFTLEIDGSSYPNLDLTNIDIDALHYVSSSEIYLSTAANENVGFDVDDGDIFGFSESGDTFAFIDGSQIGLFERGIDASNIRSSDLSDIEIYLSLDRAFCFEGEDDTLCVDDGDVVLLTGDYTAGNVQVALCFDASEYPGLDDEDIDAIHFDGNATCQEPIVLPDPSETYPPPEPEYILQVVPYHLDFTATEGDVSPLLGSIEISEINGRPLTWTLTEDASWLALDIYAGETPSIVNLSVDPAGLFAGVYTGTVTISATNAFNGPQDVQVVLEMEVGYGTVPISLTAESGFSNIQLAWNPTNDPYVETYQVSRAISGTQDTSIIATITDTVYFDADPVLVPDVVYCYQVAAVRYNGDTSAVSNQACAPYRQLELWVQSVSAAPGEIGIVTVGIRNADGLRILTCDIWLDFDNDVIFYMDVVSPTALTTGYQWDAGLTPGNNGLQRLRIGTFSLTPPTMYNDGALFEIPFQVVGNPGDTSPLDLVEYIEGVGGSAIYQPDDLINPIPLVLEDSTFVVSGDGAYVRGDLNGDGAVQFVDGYLAALIAQGEAAPSPEQLQAGDINADGTVDAEDITLLHYYADTGTWPGLPISGTYATRASEQPTILSLSDTSGLPGEKVTTVLSGLNLVDVAGATLVLAYDPTLIANIEDVEVTDLTDEFDLEFSDSGAGLLYITLVGDTPLTGDGDLLQVSLVLQDHFNGGETAAISLEAVRLNDIYGRDLAHSAVQQPVQWNDGLVEIINQPILYVSMPALYWNATEGGPNPESRSFIINNHGTGSLNWYVSEITPWLALDQLNGVAPSIANLSVDITGWEPGVYEGIVHLTSLEDPADVVTIQVTLEIQALPKEYIYIPLLLK